jgi:hypothetical protein
MKKLFVYYEILIVACGLTIFPCRSFSVESDIIKNMCFISFEKINEIPIFEKERYCSCVSAQAAPKLSNYQMALIGTALGMIEKNKFSPEMIKNIENSGISNVTSQAKEYCIQQYWSEGYKLVIGTNGFELLINCDNDTHTSSVSITIKNKNYKGYFTPVLEGATKDLDSYLADPQKVKVTYSIDGLPAIHEYWEEGHDFIHITLSPSEPEVFWRKISLAKRMSMQVIDAKNTIFNSKFDFYKQFPSGWQACKPML